jgi:hypothetical protein
MGRRFDGPFGLELRALASRIFETCNCRDPHDVGLTSRSKIQPFNMNRFESERPGRQFLEFPFYGWNPKTTAVDKRPRIAQAEERTW